MSFISDEYKELNAQLHKDRDSFGKNGSRWAHVVYKYAVNHKTTDILDYGCGKSTLSHHLPFSIKQYDPCVWKYEDLPEPADIVVCTDVLEHIEPFHIDDVIKHLCSLIKKIGVISVSNAAALKTLPDGRNAHLIQANTSWWENKLKKYVEIKEKLSDKNESMFLVEKKGDLLYV